LAWDPVPSASLAGYKVYFGPAAGNYIFNLEVGNITTYNVASLVEGQTYHFAVTAYDATHTESAFSNDVSGTVPNSAPVANFSASPTSGTAPLTVNFTSTSTGSITTYAWNFGDGGTSSLQNPAHVFNTAGVYGVSLTATGPGGSNTISHLITATSQVNVALAANGGVASASSTYNVPGYNFAASSVNNGEPAGINWGHGGGWNDATANTFPDWVEIDFNGTKNIDHVVVYTLQDNYQNPLPPTDSMTFTQYGITAFTVQGSNGGGSWMTLGTVSGNNLVKRTVNFSPITVDRIRITITGALAGYSRITEIEAWGTNVGPPPQTNFALAANGGVARASSTYNVPGYNFAASSVIDGEPAGINWGHGGGWNDATANTFPDWVEIDFNGAKNIDHVVVYTVQDNYNNPLPPTDTMTFTLYGITAFTVQGSNGGGSWVTLGTVSGNNLVKRTVNFSPTTIDRIRIKVTSALAGYSRIVEIEAWGN
jgi:PKD repeat protein